MLADFHIQSIQVIDVIASFLVLDIILSQCVFIRVHCKTIWTEQNGFYTLFLNGYTAWCWMFIYVLCMIYDYVKQLFALSYVFIWLLNY